MKGDKVLSKIVLRRCFFAYSFPYFAWLFHIYSFLSKTQKELLQRKFRNELRLVHRCPYTCATDLLRITNEKPSEEYVKKYIKKSNLIRLPFYNDIFYWNSFRKSKNDHFGHFFRMKRVRLMSTRHQSLLLQWFEFLYT